MDLLKVAEQAFANENVAKYPEFKAGDTITVTCKIKEGDKIAVKVINIDPSGKVKLSRKAAVADGIPEDIHESLHGSKAAELLK